MALPAPLPSLRLETDRFGPFSFMVGVDLTGMGAELTRVDDAWRMFSMSPLAQVANRLQREVLVQSVFGTNTIEGANLTEEETNQALDLDPAQVQAEQEIRVRNIKAAYELAVRRSETPGWELSVDYLCQLHAEICRDLPHADNRPGLIRDNPRDRPTVVGDVAHGGIYKPPQYGRDIHKLVEGLVDWHRQLLQAEVSPLIRAPLVHLYFELIHPFWDGNGRVGRVVEATLLRQAGYKYAPFALAKFYQEQIHRYFTLFNQSRKAAKRDERNANHAFVAFHLEGLRVVIERLHARVNQMVHVLLYENFARQQFDAREINARQYAIVRQIIENGPALPAAALRADPRYQAMYLNKTDKTRQRDMRRLLDSGLIRQDDKGRLWPGFVRDKEQNPGMRDGMRDGGS